MRKIINCILQVFGVIFILVNIMSFFKKGNAIKSKPDWVDYPLLIEK